MESQQENGERVCVKQTSSKRPSILNDHAGIPSPVSKFTVGSPLPSGVCHTCPETVWLRKRRNVRVV